MTVEPSPTTTTRTGEAEAEGVITLVSAGVALRVAGENVSSVDGTLVAKGTRESSGSDAVGAYTSLAVDWILVTPRTTSPSSTSHGGVTVGLVIWTTVYVASSYLVASNTCSVYGALLLHVSKTFIAALPFVCLPVPLPNSLA